MLSIVASTQKLKEKSVYLNLFNTHCSHFVNKYYSLKQYKILILVLTKRNKIRQKIKYMYPIKCVTLIFTYTSRVTGGCEY